MSFVEMDNEQRRQLIDTQQAFSVWRPAKRELERLPSLVWKTSKGHRYLGVKRGVTVTLIGAETPELVKRKHDNDARKKALKARVSGVTKRLDRMAGVNKALGLGRLPRIVARILNELDREALLGDHVIVAGTNVLYAYEVAFGVFIGGELRETRDADLLWDARRELRFATTEHGREGLMGILRRVDPSFTAEYGYNPTNNEGYIVDFLMPELKGRVPLFEKFVSGDVEPVEMPGLIWLLDAPKLEQTVIADDGWPVRIVVPEPRTFALHKLWVSRQDSRKPLSRTKDAAHAALVGQIIRTYSNSRFLAKDMPWLPQELKSLLKEKMFKQ